MSRVITRSPLSRLEYAVNGLETKRDTENTVVFLSGEKRKLIPIIQMSSDVDYGNCYNIILFYMSKNMHKIYRERKRNLEIHTIYAIVFC